VDVRINQESAKGNLETVQTREESLQWTSTYKKQEEVPINYAVQSSYFWVGKKILKRWEAAQEGQQHKNDYLLCDVDIGN